MAAPTKKNKATINKTNIQSMKPPTAPGVRWTTLRDNNPPGFQVVCGRNGGKAFEVFKRIKGVDKVVRIRLGTIDEQHPELQNKIEEVREIARGMIDLLKAGKDPRVVEQERLAAEKAAELAAKEAVVTLRTAVDEYLKDQHGRLKDSTKATARRAVNQMQTHAGKEATKLLDLPIKDIPGSQVKLVHHLHSQISPSAADGAMRILSAAVSHHYDALNEDNEDAPPIRNPIKVLSARRTGRKALWNKVDPRTVHIEDSYLDAWWKATESVPGDVKLFLRLLLFSGLRFSEAAGLDWKNIDEVGKTITIPATKNGRPHLLPLSDGIKGCLPLRAKDAMGLVFPVINEARVRKCRNLITKASGKEVTCHDLRRTCVTIANRVGISPYTTKRILNHTTTSRDVTSSVYVQVSLDDVRVALDKIYNHIMAHITAEEATTSTKQLKAVG